MNAPVVFFIDPEIDKDADLKTATTITLSYSFFPAKAARQSPSLALRTQARKPRTLRGYAGA